MASERLLAGIALDQCEEVRRVENARRQETHLVVADEPPRPRGEEGEVRKPLLPVGAPGEDLVGGEGHGPGLLLLARVLGNVVRRSESVNGSPET